eukprot:CAMPEP_0119360066 /NCGR_PEP_ID=MMETSP1334-20130426/7786_1 /TAXON_ID=127549 /ORGANISM="Calcidiscus leptoporus, Strain RCC1130" /LENGTH=345 /DNA_ID=CAMNT_0007374841 /DNA_START=72 /DNA_END=1110 /DNA_ORIENTATION=+
MAAPLVGRTVRIEGLTGRPELNGRVGHAVSFNDNTGRYNVQLRGAQDETLALRPMNVAAADSGSHGGSADSGDYARGGAGAPTEATGPFGLNARHAAAALVAFLVFVVGFSVLNAALLGGLGYLAYTASKREGGVVAAARSLSRNAATLLQRLTGSQLTPLQAGFLVVCLLCLLWYFFFGVGSSGGGAFDRRFDEPRSWWTGTSGSPHQSSRHQHRRLDEEYGGGYSGGFLGSGWDVSALLSTGMLGLYIYKLGGGGTPAGWSASQVVHRVRNMDLWQLMMLTNLLSQVLGGGGRRRGMPMTAALVGVALVVSFDCQKRNHLRSYCSFALLVLHHPAPLEWCNAT